MTSKEIALLSLGFTAAGTIVAIIALGITIADVKDLLSLVGN